MKLRFQVVNHQLLSDVRIEVTVMFIGEPAFTFHIPMHRDIALRDWPVGSKHEMIPEV